ncbi:EAL-associated domain-containing protein, partial [Klebsiella pneumoniae]|uniref:EAL-associated domain-containing protein n=1 Tax=Klebsiella pneumoniae TaxID=573 RepID=UPI00272EFE90
MLAHIDPAAQARPPGQAVGQADQRQDAWQADSRYLGHNWSWRPYFYHLLAEGWEERRLTLSSTYRDATSNQYCLTAGQFFDNGQRLLL